MGHLHYIDGEFSLFVDTNDMAGTSSLKSLEGLPMAIKSASHHWWPESLSAFWADQNGAVNWLQPDGAERQSKHSTWGAITNGHTVKLGPEWEFSFEGDFGRADSNFPSLINHFLQLDSEFTYMNAPLEKRLLEILVEENLLKKLRECLASLIVRSPQNRNKAIITAEHYRGEISNKREKHNLIGINLSRQLKGTISSLAGGKFIFVFSEFKEFIFGDGTYHNIPMGHSNSSNVKLIMPLTPELTVIYFRPLQYHTMPNAFTLRLQDGEVEKFNDLVQVYSKDKIFYRSQRPTVKDDFAQGQHLEFTYHRLRWLDEIIEEAAHFGTRRMFRPQSFF
jgi:hypothetical protein